MQLIPREKQCDRVIDCEDATDEENCTCKDYLVSKDKDFKFLICDGYVDCDDGSDEKDCGKCFLTVCFFVMRKKLLKKKIFFLVFCKNDQYHCIESKTCIESNEVCNGRKDCLFGEDESECCELILIFCFFFTASYKSNIIIKH